MISFSVHSVPIAQPRQRHTRFGHNYTPKTHPVNAFKASCQLAAVQARKGAMLEGPVELRVRFIMPRPQAKIWKTKEMPREWHSGKPDLDNLLKAVKDALTCVLWRDDSQVSRVISDKVVADGHESPRVLVVVSSLTGSSPIGKLCEHGDEKGSFPSPGGGKGPETICEV